jgi:hypothetical protein
MSYHHQPGQPQLGATFVPGGFDDYYMPAPSPEVISPAPQRFVCPLLLRSTRRDREIAPADVALPRQYNARGA